MNREIELVTKKRQEQLLAIQVSNAASISQKHNPDSSLMAPLKSDIDSALGQLVCCLSKYVDQFNYRLQLFIYQLVCFYLFWQHKHEEQLINLSDTQTGMKVFKY